jgi:class 3 adenylate cyclase
MDSKGKRKLAAVMFTDIEGYTALVSKDEELALSYVRVHRKTLTEKTEKYEGEVIEFYGDGSLSVYDSAVDAVKCAIEMQQVYRKDDSIPVRIGIHLGDIVIREGSVFGNGVNVASRIESIGVSGNILISEQVNRELHNQSGIETAGMGKFAFKNVKEKIEVFAVRHPDVLLPSKKSVSGAKGKRVNSRLGLYILSILAGISFIAFFLYYHGILLPGLNAVKTERIAVPSFKNFSGSADLDYLGEMAAHWITKELIQTESANVVDFYTNNEIQQMSIGSGPELNRLFAKQSGALNIVDGAFNRHSADSFTFSAYIKKIDDGTILYAFDPVSFNIENPTLGIKKLADIIKGYWDTRDELLLSIPRFDSYKFYMDARNQWLRNDELAKTLLLKSISADSSFLDPYLLLLGYHYNYRNYHQAHELIDILEEKTENLSSREQNVLNYMSAVIHGNNKECYDIVLKDIEENKRDFFTSTDFLVFALELVNNPAKVIELFEADPMEDVNLETCSYCQERFFLAIVAYIKLGQYNKASSLLDQFPDARGEVKYYSIQIRLHIIQNEDGEVAAVIDKAKKYGIGMDYRILFYTTSREYFNRGDMEKSSQYAYLILSSFSEDHWAKDWAYYFLGKYPEALAGFNKRISEGYNLHRSHSQVGIIHVILGDTIAAEQQLVELDELNSEFDFGNTPYCKARIILKMGKKDKALTLLRKSVDQGAKFYVNNVFDNDPDLQGLIDDPEFQKIIHPSIDQ